MRRPILQQFSAENVYNISKHTMKEDILDVVVPYLSLFIFNSFHFLIIIIIIIRGEKLFLFCLLQCVLVTINQYAW